MCYLEYCRQYSALFCIIPLRLEVILLTSGLLFSMSTVTVCSLKHAKAEHCPNKAWVPLMFQEEK